MSIVSNDLVFCPPAFSLILAVEHLFSRNKVKSQDKSDFNLFMIIASLPGDLISLLKFIYDLYKIPSFKRTELEKTELILAFHGL